VFSDLYSFFSQERGTLVEMTWAQHSFHESRRWSATKMIEAIDLENLSDTDKLFIWNAGRAELTTKPGADRLTRLADKECRYWQSLDPALAAIMQSCGTWSRYWNEEEAHHEASFNQLSALLGLEEIPNDTFIEFRQVFPDDDMLRTLFLLAISEITAAVNYGSCARRAKDPGLVALFKQVAADEIQHMRYFLAFARGLLDSEKYKAKDAFAIAYFFLRENGDLIGSLREKTESRSSHVNWWDHLEVSGIEDTENLDRKRQMIFSALYQVTNIKVDSSEEVERTWMAMVGC
jgi:rubrerythrin